MATAVSPGNKIQFGITNLHKRKTLELFTIRLHSVQLSPIEISFFWQLPPCYFRSTLATWNFVATQMSLFRVPESYAQSSPWLRRAWLHLRRVNVSFELMATRCNLDDRHDCAHHAISMVDRSKKKPYNSVSPIGDRNIWIRRSIYHVQQLRFGWQLPQGNNLGDHDPVNSNCGDIPEQPQASVCSRLHCSSLQLECWSPRNFIVSVFPSQTPSMSSTDWQYRIMPPLGHGFRALRPFIMAMFDAATTAS